MHFLPHTYSYSLECEPSTESDEIESYVDIQIGNQHWIGFLHDFGEYRSLNEALTPRRLCSESEKMYPNP